MKVRTSVIPVAGFGTRMLPASRSVPKPMLPVLDTPIVHLAVLEAVEAGIEHIIFVASKGQDAVRAYFEHLPELERGIEAKGDTKLLERMLAIPRLAQFSCVEQKRQLGLGDAILSAADAIREEPFAVLLPDDVIWSEEGTTGAMVTLFAEHGRPVIAVREVPDERVSSLGIVDAAEIADLVYTISGMVEKPPLDKAPSNLAIIGRYVLDADIFEAIRQTQPGAGGEVQITDAIASMIPGGVYAYRFPGTHVDVGRPLGLLQASVIEALRRPDMASELQEWLRDLNR